MVRGKVKKKMKNLYFFYLSQIIFLQENGKNVKSPNQFTESNQE